MWIVKLALRRPYTFVVMALLILLLGVTSIKKTPTDIFAEIDIPVVTVVWQYAGLSPDQMAKQITTSVPVGRVGAREEIAAAVLYLCSDAAKFTTGTSLVVDGGFIAA